MTDTVDSIHAEFVRYKALAEAAIAQINDQDLSVAPSADDNSIATICSHIAGNLESRFTDFLTSDGEKPWRNREAEFQPRTVSRADLMAQWSRGWDALLTTLSALTDDELHRSVSIRRQPLQVNEALVRSLAHVAYHVGQVVYIAKSLRGGNWNFLSIPPGQSDAYNRSPANEKPMAHGESLASWTNP